jgi:3-hydroxyisobutyrate dehydrogenase-like beta-hydroxyacid dehydrogenase
MATSVTIVAPGNMGAAIGRRLAENGVRVTTSLAGRSAASAKRAEAAGMQAIEDAALVRSDLVLSIVPPGDAVSFAERMAPHLASATRKPVFVDCNAISPATVARIGEIIAPTGAPFVDGGIIGAPPQPGSKGPVLYVSGELAGRIMVLRAHGLDVRVVEGGIGAASALKMSYAGITKGLTALGAAMMLGATRGRRRRGALRRACSKPTGAAAMVLAPNPGDVSEGISLGGRDAGDRRVSARRSRRRRDVSRGGVALRASRRRRFGVDAGTAELSRFIDQLPARKAS